jgi:deoxyribodipyrimidine photo-lyase
MTNATTNPKGSPGAGRPRALVWHRRDLRVDDNQALFECLQAGFVPVGAFVFDRDILDALPPEDRRVDFIHGSVAELALRYARHGCEFVAVEGRAAEAIARLAAGIGAQAVFFNRDYEASAKDRDDATATALAASSIPMLGFKDQVVHESGEILTLGGQPFSVFTPYKNAWLKQFAQQPPAIAPSAQLLRGLGLPPSPAPPIPTLDKLGFSPAGLSALGVRIGESGAKAAAKLFATRIAQYGARRDIPSTDGTSRIGVHLRFGTASVRRLAIWAHAVGGLGAETWLSELIWREFYSAIADRFPGLAQGECFQPKYQALRWENDPAKIHAWKSGATGVPIVDAAMRELAQTGHMHNRARMIAASYLCKHLDCDWRIGEAHFASLLLDFDFASNNGGWQWSASTGCDAQPYFRIFNPALQSKRFDPDGAYIKRWVTELATCPPSAIDCPIDAKPILLSGAGILLGQNYPMPLVDHATARKAALAKYASC